MSQRKKFIFNPLNYDQGRCVGERINDVLEHHFRKEQTPTDREIHFLAESLQLERKSVRIWFSNRRLKEKRRMLFTPITWPEMSPVELISKEIRYAEILMKQSKKIGSRNGIDLFDFPLVESTGQGGLKRFHFGKFNQKTQQRTAILVTNDSRAVQKEFIDQIINYIVNVKEEDKFRFQLVEEEGRYSNYISVYDIHPADGFRIPYSLKILVIPHSGDWEDSGQLFRDQKVAEMFREFTEAKDGIKELNMICNLIINNGNTQQPFLSIFGKDVEENINNWELSQSFSSDTCSWQEVVHHFFTVMTRMEPKSLSSTKLVLNERKDMEETLIRLGSLITAGLAKTEEINQMKEMTRYFQSQIERDVQQVTYMLPNLPVFSTSLVNNVWNTNPISRLREDQSDIVYKVYYEAEKKLKDIKSKGQYSVRLMENDLFLNGTALLKHFQMIWRGIQQMNRIALHGNSFLTQRVFDLLFDAEQHLKEIGFNKQLETMKKSGI